MNVAIFDLIKSMSKTEKRHFKVQAKTNPKNQNLVSLFDIIESQDEYDEQIVKSKVKDEAFLKHFAVNKNRLYDFVLKSLRSYYSSYNTQTQILNQLTEIEILYSKKLYSECSRRILKAKASAKEHGLNWVLYRLNHWQEKLLKEEGKYLKSSLESLSELHQENETVLKSLSDSNTVKFHYYKLLLHARNVSTLESYRLNEVQSAIIRVNSKELDHDGFINYLNLKALYSYFISRHEESLDLYKEVVDFIENIPDGIKDFNHTYFIALNNILITQAMCHQYTESSATLAKIHEIFYGNRTYEREFFTLTSCYELSIYAVTGNIEKAQVILDSVHDNLDQYNLNDINRYFFYFNLAKVTFYQNDFSASQRWINELINDYNKKRKESLNNLYYYGNIFFLFLQYEKGDLEYLNSQIHSIKRLLLQIRPLNDVDIKVVNLLEGLTLASVDKHLEMFEKTKRELDYLLQLPQNPSVAQFFDVISWLEGKIYNKPMREIIQNKHTQSNV
ncbi:MAG: hypothetical protein ACI9J3_000377 [Parvicellaceae bacterium]|jgi:hypothetical protein